MSSSRDDDLPSNWDREAWAESAREYAANRPRIVRSAAEEQERDLNARLDALAAKSNGRRPLAEVVNRMPIRLHSAFPIDEAGIALRDWLILGLLLKRHVSLLVAPPSSAKSLFSLQVAIMVAAGIPWAGWVPRGSERVLVINAEDDLDEMYRRLCASARRMGISQEALADRILLAETPESIVIAKADKRTKAVTREPLLEELIATITEAGVGLIIVDPFAETFEGDENSNSEVKWAGILWREVARRTGAALLLVHHTRKGSNNMAGDPDASRGGGALIGTARIVSTLMPMAEAEAIALDVPIDERTDYVQFNDAKANYSRLENARWFKKVSVMLDNARDGRLGDEVGVLMPWNPPGVLGNMSLTEINVILDEVDLGILGENGPTGQYYTASNTTSNKTRWVGRFLMERLGRSEKVVKKLIKSWLESGVLMEFEYEDGRQRKLRTGVRAPQQKRPGKVTDFVD